MIIGLSGYARSGKDTVAEFLVNAHSFTQRSFASKMKEAVYTLNPIVQCDSIGSFRYQNLVDNYGLEYVKDNYPEARRLLQVFGTEVGRSMFGSDFWVNLALNDVSGFNTVISDVRFRNEADAIRAQGGQIWRINRKEALPAGDHSSETDLDTYDFDFILENNLTISKLHKKINEELVNANT